MRTMEVNIHAAMASLSQKRRIFHLEADFQFALAWELQIQCNSRKIRLEKPVSYDEDWRIDIEVRTETGVFPIELKYLKKALTFEDIDEVDKEEYILADGVQDMEMYSCFADIAKLEKHCRQTPRLPPDMPYGSLTTINIGMNTPLRHTTSIFTRMKDHKNQGSYTLTR